MSHGERRTARSLGISSPCPLPLDNSARGRSSLKNAEAGNFFCAWQRQRDQRPGFRSSEPAQPYLAEQVQPGREDVPGMLRPTIQRSDTLHCKYCSSIYYKEKKNPFIRNTVYRHARVYNVSANHGKMLQLYILLAHNTVSTHTCKVTRIALHLYSPIHLSHIELSMCRAPSGVSMWRTAHSD